MPSISKRQPEIFTLPNGVNIFPSDTHHTLYYKHIPFSTLWTDVHKWLDAVFGSDYSISREDMENLLRVLNPQWQKKALRGYFFRVSWNKDDADISKELEEKINSFPTESWTDENWQSFWSLAPKPLSKKPKMSTQSSDIKHRRSRYLGHDALFRAVVFGYEGSHNSLDGRGDR